MGRRRSVGCGDRQTALTVRSRSTTRTPVTGCPPRERREQGDPSVSASGLQETVCGARPADGHLAAIWRQKRWLEKVDELVRREDCWATTRTSCAEVRWGESSAATPCVFPRLLHWQVFAVPLGVVDSRRSKGCWVFDHSFPRLRLMVRCYWIASRSAGRMIGRCTD